MCNRVPLHRKCGEAQSNFHRERDGQAAIPSGGSQEGEGGLHRGERNKRGLFATYLCHSIREVRADAAFVAAFAYHNSLPQFQQGLQAPFADAAWHALPPTHWLKVCRDTLVSL